MTDRVGMNLVALMGENTAMIFLVGMRDLRMQIVVPIGVVMGSAKLLGLVYDLPLIILEEEILYKCELISNIDVCSVIR